MTDATISDPASESAPRVAAPPRRVASLTVGQSPRSDIWPDILSYMHLPIALDVEEFGVLDGLSETEISALAPNPGENSLATRLRDGRNVTISKQRVAERLEVICRSIDSRKFDLLVILSTGLFREFESPCLMVNAQRAMDAIIAAITAAGQTVGIIYPLHRQMLENSSQTIPGFSQRLSHAESGSADALRRASTDLAGCDLVVLNSVGFTEADRVAIAGQTGHPVILARRVLAGAIRLLLDPGGTRIDGTPAPGPPPNGEVDDRVRTLTPRERQVMSLVAEGLSNKAIARQFGISPRTVEIHRAKMMGKMGAVSVGALIRMALAAQHPGL